MIDGGLQMRMDDVVGRVQSLIILGRSIFESSFGTWSGSLAIEAESPSENCYTVLVNC